MCMLVRKRMWRVMRWRGRRRQMTMRVYYRGDITVDEMSGRGTARRHGRSMGWGRMRRHGRRWQVQRRWGDIVAAIAAAVAMAVGVVVGMVVRVAVRL